MSRRFVATHSFASTCARVLKLPAPPQLAWQPAKAIALVVVALVVVVVATDAAAAAAKVHRCKRARARRLAHIWPFAKAESCGLRTSAICERRWRPPHAHLRSACALPRATSYALLSSPNDAAAAAAWERLHNEKASNFLSQASLLKVRPLTAAARREGGRKRERERERASLGFKLRLPKARARPSRLRNARLLSAQRLGDGRARVVSIRTNSLLITLADRVFGHTI